MFTSRDIGTRGGGAMRIKLLRTHQHIEFLAQHVNEELGVPKRDSSPRVSVKSTSEYR